MTRRPRGADLEVGAPDVERARSTRTGRAGARGSRPTRGCRADGAATPRPVGSGRPVVSAEYTIRSPLRVGTAMRAPRAVGTKRKTAFAAHPAAAGVTQPPWTAIRPRRTVDLACRWGAPAAPERRTSAGPNVPAARRRPAAPRARGRPSAPPGARYLSARSPNAARPSGAWRRPLDRHPHAAARAAWRSARPRTAAARRGAAAVAQDAAGAAARAGGAASAAQPSAVSVRPL